MEEQILNYQKILKSNPTDVPAFKALEEIFLGTDNWKALVQLYEDRIRVIEDPEQERILTEKCASLWHLKIGNPQKALFYYEQLQHKLPDSRSVLDGLEDIYTRSNEWGKLAEVLEQLSLVVQDAVERANVQNRLGILYAGILKRPERALISWNHALISDPKRKDIMDAMARIYRDRGFFLKVRELLDREAAMATEPDPIGQKYLALGKELLEEPLMQKLARETLEKARGYLAAPGQAEEALALLEQEETSWEEKVRRLRVVAIESPDKSKAVALYCQIAQIYFVHQADEKLIEENLNKCIMLQPANPRVLAFTERYYMEKKTPLELIHCLEEMVSRVKHQQTLVLVLERIAFLTAVHLQDQKASIQVYKRILDKDPTHSSALESLVEFFQEHGEWAEVVNLLRQKADRESRPLDRADILAQIAHITSERLKNPEAARLLYEEILRLDKYNTHAAVGLSGLYEKAKDWPGVIRCLELLLQKTADRAARLGLLSRILEINASSRGDAVEAFLTSLRLLAMEPTGEGYLANAIALGEQTGRFKELVDALGIAVARLGPAPASLPLLAAVARIQLERLNSAPDATKTYHRILDIESQNLAALEALERIHTTAGDSVELVQILQKQLELAQSAERKREILYKQASIYQDRMADFPRAISVYRTILQLDEKDVQAQTRLAELFELEGQWEAAAECLERSAALLSDPGAVIRAKVRLCGIFEQRLNNTERALVLCQEILLSQQTEAGQQAEAVAVLERLQVRGVEALRIAEILQPYYALIGDWRRHIDMLELRLPSSGSADERLGMLERIGQIYEEQLGQKELSFSSYGRAFLEAPTGEVPWKALTRLADEIGRQEELAGYIEEVLKRLEDPALVLSFNLFLGGLYHRSLNRPRQSIVCYRRALESDKGNAESLGALHELFRTSAEWGELSKVLRARAILSEDPLQKAALLLELAQVTETELHDRPTAIEILKQVLEHRGDDREVLDKLDLLLEREARWAELADVLERKISCSENRDITELNLRLGKVRGEKMEERLHAVTHYRQVLAEQPGDPRAIEGLESLLGRPDSAGSAAEILIPIYEEKSAWAELARALEVRAEHESDPGVKVDLLLRVAELYERQLNQRERTFVVLRRALSADSSRQEVLTAMERLAERSGDYTEITAALEDAVSTQKDPKLQVGLLEMLALQYRDKLRRPELAATCYRRLLEIEPVHQHALSGLEAIFRESKSLSDLVWILTRQAEVTQDPERRRVFWIQVAQIQEEQLGSMEEAIKAYERVFAENPKDIHIAKLLDRLYLMSNRWEDDAKLLIKMAELSKNVLGYIEYQSRLAVIYASKMDDPQRALTCYSQVLSKKPNHLETIRQIENLLKMDRCRQKAAEVLEHVYLAQSEWRKLAAILELRLVTTTEPGLRLELFARLRELYEQKIDEKSLAFNVSARAFKEQPQDEAAQRDLSRLAEARGWYEELVQVYGDVIDCHVGTELAAGLRKRVALIQERFLNRRVEAIRQWENLLALQGRDPEVLGNLERLYREEGNFGALVEVYRKQSEMTDVVDQKKDLLFRAAACLAEGVEDLDGAIGIYRQILDFDPQDRRAWKLLDGLIVSGEQWEELPDVLAREIDLLPDEIPAQGQDDLRLELMLRLADVHLKRLSRFPEGMSVLREVLKRSPLEQRAQALLEPLMPREDLRGEVAQLLEPIYRALGDFRKLVAIMEVLLAVAANPEERRKVLFELLTIYEENLNQKPLAFLMACRAFRENADDEAVRQNLERLAQATGSFEELVAVYEEVEDRVGTVLKGIIQRRLAQLKESYLEDKGEAVSHWRHVLASNPDDLEALRALERLNRERGAFSELAGILRHMAGLETSPEKKKDYLHEVATLMEERLGLPDAAIEAYREILAEDPQDLPVWRLLDRLLEKTERWIELGEVLLSEINMVSDSEMLPLELRLADLYRLKLAAPGEAVTLYGAILRDHPGHAQALSSVVAMFDASEALEATAEILVEQLEARGDFQRLVLALDVVAQSTPDPMAKKRLYLRMARIFHNRLGQRDMALDSLGRAVVVDPGDEQMRMALEKQILETERFEKLAAIYLQALEECEDRAVQLTLRRRLASLFKERLKDSEGALHHLQAVIALEPADTQALKEIERIYEERGEYDALIDVLRKNLKLCQTPQETVSLLARIAGIYEEKLQDLGGAIQVYREVLGIIPQDIRTLTILERLCTRQGRPKELAEVLSAQIEIKDRQGDRSALDLRFRLAHLYEEEFSDMKRASGIFLEILKADPAHPATVEHLEGLLADGRLFEGATRLLEAAYEKTSDWKKYIELLEDQVRQSQVMARRMELLSKIAEVQERRMGLKTLAFNTCVRMFHEDMESVETRALMERLAQEDDNPEALATVYEENLDNIEEPTVGVPIALKLGELYRQVFQDPDKALSFYRRVLSFEPKNQEALRSLELLYESQERWTDLIAVLSTLVDIRREPADQIALLYRLGVLTIDKLKETSKAVGYFRQVLNLDGGHLESLIRLEKAFIELSDHESLFKVLRARLKLTKAQREQLELIARLADLSARYLARPDMAIDLWRKVVELDPLQEEAQDKLDKLYEETERWPELAELLERRIERTMDPERIAVLSSRLGWVKGEKLGELSSALVQWQEVLRLDPKNAVALQALRKIFASSGKWDELLSVLRKLVPLQEDMVGVKNLRFELAEILGDKLSRPEEAIEAAKRAQDIEPHTTDDLTRLARIFQSNEAWNDAVAVLEHLTEQKGSDLEKIEALMEVASIWKDRIGKPLGAAPAYEKILEIDPYHEDAFRKAEAIYRENKEWRRLTMLLGARLDRIRERKDRLALQREIASIYEEQLGQKELAFARICAAFREDFSDDNVLIKLESLAKDTEDYDTLLEVLKDATDEIKSGPRAVLLFQKIAEIYLRYLGNSEEAERWLRAAVDLDKRRTESLDALSEMYRDQGRYQDLVLLLETKYERSTELDQRKEIRYQIAQIEEQQLVRMDAAIDSYRRILEIDGRDSHAIQSLIRLYQHQERWLDLVGIYKRAAEQADQRAAALHYLFQIASIWETELADDEQAIEAYRAVLEVDPTHEQSLKALERIYTRLDRWAELLSISQQEVEVVKDSAQKVKIYSKMGAIWEERFGNVEEAASCHSSILEIEPNNLASIKAFERLVRRLGDFKRLIELYYRHITLIQDRPEIVEIYLAIGHVWYRELSRADKAEEAYLNAIKIDDHARTAIHCLGELYEKSGNWFNAIEMLKKEADLSGASADTVEIYYRLGKINEDMLLDSAAARQMYVKALSLDPAYLPAVKALKLIYYLEKEYDQYLQMMIQEAEYTEDMEEKTRLNYEIGRFFQEQRDDTAQASHFYEESLYRTADFLPAAKPLADIYFRSEDWEKAEKMMEIVVAGLDRNTESKELCRQYYRLGYITEKLGKEDRALEHYRMSYELDATYLPALEGLGNALLKAQRWEEAHRIFQTILIHHRDSLSDAEVAELYWQIGDVSYRMGEVERAVIAFRKSLEIDDSHLAALEYVLRIQEQKGNWEEVYDYGMRMVESLSGEDLFTHYLKLASICRVRLNDPFRSIDTLIGAHKIHPDNLEVLEALLTVYQGTRQHQKTLDIIEEIVKLDKSPQKVVTYHHQAGTLCREELRDETRSAEHFNAALDIDPSHVDSFVLLGEMFYQKKDWINLKESYLKMLKRIPTEARRTKLVLWKDLAELCRVVLRTLTESIDGYRMVTSLDPNDVESLSVLGDLLAVKPATRDEAISTHHQVIVKSAERVGSYRILWKLYNEKKHYDKVFVLASILKYLKKADDEELKIVSYFKRKAPPMASRPVTDNVWESLMAHADVRVPFTRIFGLLYRMAPSMFVVEHKDVNLRRRDHWLDPEKDRSLFVHNFRQAARIMSGVNVEIFALKTEEAPHPPGLAIALTRPTSIIAYKQMFMDDKQKNLLFFIGRQLAMVRPEFILACALPYVELENLLIAACQLAEPNFNPECGDLKGIERARTGLKRALTDSGLSMVQRAVADHLKEPTKYNLKRWVEGVEHSVNRAGLVVCNDLGVALSTLRSEQGGLTSMRPIQRFRELLVFASGPEYLSLRETIGLSVSG